MVVQKMLSLGGPTLKKKFELHKSCGKKWTAKMDGDKFILLSFSGGGGRIERSFYVLQCLLGRMGNDTKRKHKKYRQPLKVTDTKKE